MKVEELVPKHKFDIETAERLFDYSYTEVRPIVPKLLEWLQDMNWPVSRPVSKYLMGISEYITEDIIAILRGHDCIWKYWCLQTFVKNEEGVDPGLIEEVERIALNPTSGEIGEGVQELAIEILDDLKNT